MRPLLPALSEQASRDIASVLQWLSRQEWARLAAAGFPPARRLAYRFVAGETLADAMAAATALHARGAAVSLDPLGESVHSDAEADRALDDAVELVRTIAAERLDAEISIKLSQFGQERDAGQAEARARQLAERAAVDGIGITLDMEGSATTQLTIDAYRRLLPANPRLGIAIQAYLHRTPQDLAELVPLGGKIRLCKGAYDEPATIAYRSRDDIDEAYRAALRVLLAPDAASFAAVATHDDAMLNAARALHPVRGRYEFQMLFGVRNELQTRVLAGGEPLRIYVPYGTHWFPYFMRRLAERPANMRFFLRALTGH